MRIKRLILAALTAAVVIPAQAQAQVASGKMRWVSAGNSYGWWWQTGSTTSRNVMGGAAYRANLNITPAPSPSWMWPASASGTAFGPAVDIYCIDFLHNAKTSSTGYDAYFTKLTTASFANPSAVNTRSGDLTRYLKAAWLITKMETYANTTANKYVRADIHAAIWNIMSGSPIATSTNNSSGSWNAGAGASGTPNWIDQANANYATIDGNQWTVVTDACVTTSGTAGRGATAVDNCSQEFLTQNVVPEPATMILLGTGLLATLAVAGVFRRPEA